MSKTNIVLSLLIGALVITMAIREVRHIKSMVTQTEIAYKIGCMEGSFNFLPSWKPDSQYVNSFCTGLKENRKTKDIMDFIDMIKKNKDPNVEISIGE